MHAVNTVGTVLLEVMDKEVSVLFCGLWRQRAVWIRRIYGPGRLSLRPLHGATFKDEKVILYVRGDEGFSGQVYDTVLELVMTHHAEAYPLAIEGVTNGKFDIADVKVIGEVWVL